jgi:MerR family transcriptional regulator, light-induced transcriptional regulator
LLTTLPGEPHGLGLLMAEALFAAEGAHCHSLGVQTPVSDLLLAADAYRADIVALSFTACITASRVHEGLADLRAKLPTSIELWAGGAAAALQRHGVDGVSVVRMLEDLPAAVQQWRDRHVPPAT